MNHKECMMFAGLWMLGTWAVLATIGCFAMAAKNDDLAGTLSSCEFNRNRIEGAYENLALAVKAGER